MASTKVPPARVARGVERAHHHLNRLQHDQAGVLPRSANSRFRHRRFLAWLHRGDEEDAK
jgi:hypothetical protein